MVRVLLAIVLLFGGTLVLSAPAAIHADPVEQLDPVPEDVAVESVEAPRPRAPSAAPPSPAAEVRPPRPEGARVFRPPRR